MGSTLNAWALRKKHNLPTQTPPMDAKKVPYALPCRGGHWAEYVVGEGTIRDLMDLHQHAGQGGLNSSPNVVGGLYRTQPWEVELRCLTNSQR